MRPADAWSRSIISLTPWASSPSSSRWKIGMRPRLSTSPRATIWVTTARMRPRGTAIDPARKTAQIGAHDSATSAKSSRVMSSPPRSRSGCREMTRATAGDAIGVERYATARWALGSRTASAGERARGRAGRDPRPPAAPRANRKAPPRERQTALAQRERDPPRDRAQKPAEDGVGQRKRGGEAGQADEHRRLARARAQRDLVGEPALQRGSDGQVEQEPRRRPDDREQEGRIVGGAGGPAGEIGGGLRR